MEPWYFPLLAVAGVAVGFLNVMAGGGSLISLPILIFLGLEPAVANGTNRVAILVQNITAVSSFRSRGYSEMRRSLGLALCTVPGAIAGAFAAVVVDPVVFKRILGVVLVAAVILILRKSPSSAGENRGISRPILAHFAMVGVGFWGGFLQAGVGQHAQGLHRRHLHNPGASRLRAASQGVVARRVGVGGRQRFGRLVGDTGYDHPR
jgi:uncharacterized membrane protein YfcA